jgi:pimeloyl-ACP methyl ester carboxylesterase
MPRSIVVVLAVAATASAGIYALFARDLAEARARLAGRSQTIDTPFGTLEYALSGDGTPLLVLHGAGGGFDQGLDMAGPLAQRGFRLIVPSRFGYLASASPPHATNAMQADAYGALLDRLGVDKAFVAASSAGVWSALQLALRHPERCRALAIIGPADYLPPGTSNYGGALLRAMYGSDLVGCASLRSTLILPGAMTRMMLGTDPALLDAAQPGERARVRATLDHLLPTTARAAGMRLDIRSATVREPYPLENISCPVLTISADDDAFGTAARARAIAASVPNGKAVIYPTGGHALVGRYADVLNEIASFFGPA